MTVIDGDLAERASPSTGQAPPVEINVLGPEFAVSKGEEALLAPRGYPAKLLAHLIAADGLMTVDAAIEGLWPGADPVAGRNRLHGVLLRLRRVLGLGAAGPISCVDGIVRIDRGGELRVDSWHFDSLVALAGDHPRRLAAAIAAYRGDVLSVQFAYDDTVDAYRTALRRRFERLIERSRAQSTCQPSRAASSTAPPSASRRSRSA